MCTSGGSQWGGVEMQSRGQGPVQMRWRSKFRKQRQSSQWRGRRPRSRGNNCMGEGIETWPHAAGWPVRKVVSCSIKREEQDGASQTTVPTGMGRAGSWLPGPFLTFHGLRGHWRCWFWVWFSKGWVEGKYLFSPTLKGFIKMCKCRVEREFKDETEGRGSGLEKSLLCG